MNVVGYVISYKEQTTDKYIENKIQQERINQFCDQNRLNLLKIYTEANTSSNSRLSLIELMNKAPQGQFSGVLVYTLDRLDTDESIREWIVQELKNHGIEVFSLTEDEDASVLQKAEKKSKTIKGRLKDLPSLPEIVTKVTELVQDPNSSAAQLGKIISHDSGLTSRVLRMVNSAYYGFPKQISSIQHAITILGFNTIKSLVLSSSIFRIFSPKQGMETVLNYQNFWKHSLLTAIASKNIYQKLFFENNENIFSAAILHDIGKIILDQYDHENYAKVMQEARNPLDSEKVLMSEQKYCDVTHQYIGHFVAESWNLPETISQVILNHHNPFAAEEHENLVVVVYIGNVLAHLILDYEVFSLLHFDEEVMRHFGLDEYFLEELFAELKQDAEQLKDLESFFK